MIAATVRVSGERLPEELRGWLKVMSGPGRRRVLESMAETVLRITWENFGESGMHRPTPWAPLSPRYQREIGYFGPPKLILSGDLIGSVQTLELTEDSVTVGSEVRYAATHQLGDGLVPARPYFPFYDSPAGEAVMTPYCEERVDAAVDRTVREIAGLAK